MAVAHAWHGARFSALAQNGKLRGLSSYIGNRATEKKSTSAAAVSFFHALKAAGLPVTITKVERKEPQHGRRL